MISTKGVRLALLAAFLATAAEGAVAVDIDVDASSAGRGSAAAFPPYWKRSFGSGHAKLTLRDDWRAHFKLAVDELGMRGVRHHGMFDDDMGPIVGGTLAAPVYNFSLLDASWDFQLAQGTKPILEFSFMPAVLAGCTWTSPASGAVVNPGFAACGRETMAYKGITEIPVGWGAWHDLVVATVRHAVAARGAAEVRTWDFEVWNELWGMAFPGDYMALYNASAMAVKAVDARLRVGGPATAQVQHVADFAAAADAAAIPYDFVSSHMYPTDPQCPQTLAGGWSPDCFTEHVKAARASLPASTPFYLTEYNVGCCLGYSQHDTSAAAAFVFRAVPALSGHVDVLSWWTFSDVFEEGGLPTTEFQDIYGLMTYHGVRKPGWRAFELLHAHAGAMRLAANVTGDSTLVAVAATATATAAATAAAASASCPTDAQLFNATDFAGHDLLPESEHLMLPTAADCCAACTNNTACGYWSYGAPGDRLAGRCYLKDRRAGFNGKGSHDRGMVSGTLPSRLPAPQCVTENATNMEGFDVGSAVAAADSGACCAACKADANYACQFWSFKAGTCHFKSSDAGRTADDSFTSGSRQDPAPPPPPGTHYQAVSALATTNSSAPGASVQVFLSHWANAIGGNGTEPRTAKVRLRHGSGAAPIKATVWRIDEQNANPQAAWQKMGSPAVPTQDQLAQLHAASALAPVATPVTAASATLSTATVSMPPNSAVLVEFEF
jgi:xylan 1,4-beta-xylosidase